MSIDELTKNIDFPQQVIKYWLAVLLNGKMVEISAGPNAEIDNQPLDHWEFHDLYFHSRSRMGRNSNLLITKYKIQYSIINPRSGSSGPDLGWVVYLK